MNLQGIWGRMSSADGFFLHATRFCLTTDRGFHDLLTIDHIFRELLTIDRTTSLLRQVEARGAFQDVDNPLSFPQDCPPLEDTSPSPRDMDYPTILYCTALHYTTLHYTTLHYTTLHYTVTILFTPYPFHQEVKGGG